MHEALAHAYGYRFWEVPNLSLKDGDLPPRDQIPRQFWVYRADGLPIRVPNQGMIVTGLATLQGIGQVVWPKIQEALPRTLLADKIARVWMGSSSTPVKLELPNGSVIRFGSAEQSRSQFEGFDIDWCWVDEPIPRWVFNGLWRGLADHFGSIWFTMTPLGQNAIWLKEYIARENVWCIQRTHRDNTYLSSEIFDEMENEGQWSKREAAARTRGQFEFGGDRVFHTLDPDVHFIDPFPIPQNWILGQTVDPHHRKAAFVSWWAIDPKYEPNYIYHFYREWPQEDYFKLEGGGKSPTEYAILFRSIEGARPANVRICDPRFGKAEWTPAGMKEKTTVWVDEMAKAGLYYDARVHGVNLLEIGHTRITEYLRWDQSFPMGPTNTPRIFIHKSCPNLMKAMQNYAYIEEKDETKGVVEKVSEEFKDPVDTVRYTVLYDLPIVSDDDGQFSERELIEENQEGWW